MATLAAPLLDEETPAEADARRELDLDLDEHSQAFCDALVGKLMVVAEDIYGDPLRKYQKPLARRLFESFLIGDGARVTALYCRQSGKTEIVALAVATAMIMLPLLAKAYPHALALHKYLKEGVQVGAFAPVERQARNLYQRIISFLRCPRATKILQNPEINDRMVGRGKEQHLHRLRSLVRQTSCNESAVIEGDHYHIILTDEAQGANTSFWNKSISPMGKATGATYVFTGTPTWERNMFYDQIMVNKREQVSRGRHRQNHFEADWMVVGREVPDYRREVLRDMLVMGEHSDEFRLSYKIEWLIERGMFTTAERMDELGDETMGACIKSWTRTPVCIGIDCGRIQDRTIVTVVLVDWNNPDQDGFYDHCILDWLDLEAMGWEEQYHVICEFISRYNVYMVGVDIGGKGDNVIDRLRHLMPHIAFTEAGVGPAEQSDRWKYLLTLFDRSQIAWPAGYDVRQTRKFKRFYQEMTDLRMEYKGPNLKCEAPDEAHAHDDYCDSLAIAASLSRQTREKADNQVQVYSNFLMNSRFRRRSRAGIG